MNIFSSISFTYVLGAQKDYLIETVLLRTHNICFGWEKRKTIFHYPLLFSSTQLSTKFILLINVKMPTTLKIRKAVFHYPLLYSSTQLSTKFILLINVKMPTTVGILTFISMINTTSERLKLRNFFTFRYFSFYEELKFRTQLSWAWKKFNNLGAWVLWIYMKVHYSKK